MKAKLKMLIAISHNAKLLILDEPTSGLDLIARDENEDVEENSKYYSLLNYLYENKERLIELCTPGLSENTPQRYLIPGGKKVKSIYLSKALSAVLDDFSHSKNITIREIVESAIIEYLMKYGYRPEVEILLSQK